MANTVEIPQMTIGGWYNAAPPTLSDGQKVGLQFDINGNLKTTGTFTGTVTADTVAFATAVAPTYGEGTEDALSMDLAGNLRVVQKVPTDLASFPITVPAGGILIVAANPARRSLTVYNPGNVSVYTAKTNAVAITNGFIPAGQSYNTTYTGALYGLVAAATQVVSVFEES